MQITLQGNPPSLNKFAGRQNSWEYRNAKAEWTQLVWVMCRASKERPPQPFDFASVEIKYYFKTHNRHDADNYAGKFLLDGLTKAGVIKDDDMSHIKLSISGGYDKLNPRTVITVTEIKEDEEA